MFNKTQNQSEICNNFYIRMEDMNLHLSVLNYTFLFRFPSSSHHRPHHLIVRVPFLRPVMLCVR